MRDQKATNEAVANRQQIPRHATPSGPAPLTQRITALQAGAGNGAVIQLLRKAGHPWAQDQPNPDCGRPRTEQAAVQRSAVHDVLGTPGQPLDAATRADMEARLGADFSDVRIHSDTAARASATEIGARAYTSGNHIVVGEGGGDRHTLAHELTHVIQQRRGPVAGTAHGNGLRLSDPSDSFEREADATATRVMRPLAPQRAPHAKDVTGTTGGDSTGAVSAHTVQRKRMETRKTRLRIQQGPSCWLFVLEALARAHGLKTSSLKVAMHAYPEEEGLGDENRRLEAVGIMAGNLQKMVEALEPHSENSSVIGRQKLESLARETGTSTCLKFIRYDEIGTGKNRVEVADAEDLVEIFEKARDRAARLLEMFQSQGSGMETILGDTAQRVKPGSSRGSTVKKLRGLREDMPVYLSVRKRFRPRDEDLPAAGQPMPDVVDWADRTDPMEPTTHALLLTGYRHGIVSYKDPNYGDIEIHITVEQFMEMTGDKRITMRSYDPDEGQLHELVD